MKKAAVFTLAAMLVVSAAGAASANFMFKQSRPAVSGRMVAHAGSPAAAQAGMDILLKGGNAFDAALAMAAAQSYSEVMMCHIFGGDLMFIAYDAKSGKVVSYNGTGWAPKKTDIDKFINMGDIPTHGFLSQHMPGEWSGWMTIMRDHGTMTLADIFAPVIDMADNGIITDEFLSNIINMSSADMDEETKKVFVPGGRILMPGDLYINKNYAKLLRTMAEVAGKEKDLKAGYQAAEDYFYRGPIAEDIVKWNAANGGDFSIEDFNEFHAEKTEPITTNYRGYDVYCTPPNSQGVVLIEALNMLENFDLKAMGHNSKDYINVLIQCLNVALMHRNRFDADPRFFEYPKAFLTKEFSKEMVAKIDMEKAVTEIPLGDEKYYVDYDKKGPDTTFMFCADKEGNVAVVTHSINHFFGSGNMVPEWGIMMNDRMIQYALDPDVGNALVGHKRTVQTITPTIVLKDGKPYMAFGTPNADRQEQTKLQGFLNVVEFGMRPQRAVETPRVATAATGDTASNGRIERGLHYMNSYLTQIDPEVIKALEGMGYKMMTTSNTGSLGLGVCENGFWTVGADPTRNAYTYGF